MKNWKTTLSGVVTGVAGIVVAQPQLFAKWPIVGSIAAWLMGGGLIALGLATKDASNHSTTAEVQAATAEQNAKAFAAANAPHN